MTQDAEPVSEPAFPDELRLRCGPIGPVDLALFAAASGDHNPLHLDPQTAQAAGFERPVVHGMLTMACAARLFTTRFGAGHLRALQVRFTGIALVGDEIELEATRIEADAHEARYRLAGRTGAGREIIVGNATVFA